MSYDLAFWKLSTVPDEEAYDLACDGIYDQFEAANGVAFFRSMVVMTWPDMNDVIEPMENDPDGSPEDISRLVLMTLPYSMTDRVPDIIKMALDFGLIGYNPQSGTSTA